MEGISGAAGSGFEPGLTDPESDVIMNDYVSMSSTGNPNAGAFSLPAYTVVWPKGWISFRDSGDSFDDSPMRINEGPEGSQEQPVDQKVLLMGHSEDPKGPKSSIPFGLKIR